MTQPGTILDLVAGCIIFDDRGFDSSLLVNYLRFSQNVFEIPSAIKTSMIPCQWHRRILGTPLSTLECGQSGVGLTAERSDFCQAFESEQSGGKRPDNRRFLV